MPDCRWTRYTRPVEAADRESLLDLLLDLQHELGKHLVMPIAMLPREADGDAVRAATARALLHTRERGGHPVSAQALWAAADAEGGAALRALPGYPALRGRVHAALAWEARLRSDDGLDRSALLADFRAVGDAIRELLVGLRESV